MRKLYDLKYMRERWGLWFNFEDMEGDCIDVMEEDFWEEKGFLKKGKEIVRGEV